MSSNDFRKWFDIVRADTPDLREEVYKLRYQIYCNERGYEDPDDHANNREIDEYDDLAVHSLLVHRRSGLVAGTVRLILAESERTARLPMYDFCGKDVIEGELGLPTATMAEISRLAISKDFRRRKADQNNPQAGLDDGDESPRGSATMLIGLLAAVMQMSSENGVTHLCAVLEPALLRILRRQLAYDLEPVGPLVYHHGWRQPAYSSMVDLAEKVKRERHEVWDLCTESGRLLKYLETAAYDDYPELLVAQL